MQMMRNFIVSIIADDSWPLRSVEKLIGWLWREELRWQTLHFILRLVSKEKVLSSHISRQFDNYHVNCAWNKFPLIIVSRLNSQLSTCETALV